MFARTRKPATTPTPIRPLTKALVDDALVLGAIRRATEHANGEHTRPCLGCPTCG